jgi:hypothetical protein
MYVIDKLILSIGGSIIITSIIIAILTKYKIIDLNYNQVITYTVINSFVYLIIFIRISTVIILYLLRPISPPVPIEEEEEQWGITITEEQV